MSQTVNKTMEQPNPSGQGQSANYYSVVIDANATPARSSNSGINAQRDGTGVCNVAFPRNVDEWAWFVSLGATDKTNQTPGCATTDLGDMNDRVVQVRTFDIAANGATTAANRPFHLYVQELKSND